MENKKYRQVGKIGNYYGKLFIMERDGKYYWIIENHSTDFDDIHEWEGISKDLFDKLNNHANKLI